MENSLRCPKCKSQYVHAGKKGFSGGKAVAGVVVAGAIGVLAGAIGKDKIVITCLNCGHQFKPGESHKPTPSYSSNIKNKNYKFAICPSCKGKSFMDAEMMSKKACPKCGCFLSDSDIKSDSDKTSMAGAVLLGIIVVLMISVLLILLLLR